MSSLPKLSYALLSHNREKTIRAAEERTMAQDCKGEAEYLFSNDCSIDRTYESLIHTYKQLKEYAHRLSPKEQNAVASFFSHMEEEIHRVGLQRSFWRKDSTNRLSITRKKGWMRPYDLLRRLPMPLF